MLHVRRLLRFCWRVLRRFHRNKGLLLSGAVAYNTLLSVVPLLGVILLLLSHLMDPWALLEIIHTQIGMLQPATSSTVDAIFAAFLEERSYAGGVSIAVLLFFSAFAFRTLEDAMEIVFETAHHKWGRHPLVSVAIPLLYIAAIALALTGFTLLLVAFDALDARYLSWMGVASAGEVVPLFIKLGGLLALVMLFTSFYRVLPSASLSFRQCLIGGTVAAVLWELVRSLLVWYFQNISLVGAIYGSLAVVVVLLLSFEAGALILLLSAQVIKEIDRSARAGMAWYEEPPDLRFSEPPPVRPSAAPDATRGSKP